MRMIAAVAVMCLLLLYVWERVDLVRLGYQIQQLKRQHSTLQHQNDELKVKVSALSSPERIARLAAQKLGMIRPHPGQVVLISLERRPADRREPARREVRLARNERY